MIEIVLDGNDGNEFLHHLYPLVIPSAIYSAPFSAYLAEAKKIISAHALEQAIIIHENDTLFSINKLALALFIISCKIENNLDFAVFKVKNRAEKTEAYKPYVALTVAVKYVMRIAEDTPKNALKDMACLSYLGLSVKQDCEQDKLFLTLQRNAPLKTIAAANFSEALIAVGTLKALALTQTDVSLKVEINCLDYETPLDTDTVIEKIIQNVMPLID